jgi:hypothetical protein
MKKTLLGMLLLLLIALLPVDSSISVINFGFESATSTVVYLDPVLTTVPLGALDFSVNVAVSSVTDLYGFEFWLGYDTSILDANRFEDEGYCLFAPKYTLKREINDAAGYVHLQVSSSNPAPSFNGTGRLVSVLFNCTGVGRTVLHLYWTILWNSNNRPIDHQTEDGSVAQFEFPDYLKAPFPDYAWSGMPDIDQKQDDWFNPVFGGWTWCGPVSVANSLWWLDSKYDSIGMPPPAISDGFPLVTAYGPWDDHDSQNVPPLVSNLAFLMDTDGMRTGIAHSGTFYVDMQVGISQYLQQQGINPEGDCDGDGDVDSQDAEIVKSAFATVPGSPNWNMAADLNQDNKIDVRDVAIVVYNYGHVGMFYEHTQEFPGFEWLMHEVLACEDVVLQLELWQDLGGGSWVKNEYDPGGMGGHYVTVAGFSLPINGLYVCDPWQDSFEMGLVLGVSPVPHPWPHAPELHNDVQFVSQDLFSAVPWVGPYPSPYPDTSIYELLLYPQALGFDPSWHAFIRSSIVTSPLAVRNFFLGNIITTKGGCPPYETISEGFSFNVNATLVNLDSVTQTFILSAYANLTFYSGREITLDPGDSIIVTFVCNTTGMIRGNYSLTITAYSAPCSADIIYGYGQAWPVPITIMICRRGDINGDTWVNGKDGTRIGAAFYPYGVYDKNADINSDGYVNGKDAVIVGANFDY